MIVLLLACMPKTTTVLYAKPPPSIEPHDPPPELAEFVPSADECPQVYPLKPGVEGPVWALVEGVPTCRAQALPDARVVELYIAEGAATYWEAVARAQAAGRVQDRLRGESVVKLRDAELDVCRTEARALRWRVTAVGAAAFILGAGTGLASAHLGRTRVEVVPAP